MELDIDFSVRDPTGLIMIQEFRKTDEVHTITTKSEGIYEFCFDNTFSTIASKTVFADLGFYQYSDDDWLQVAGTDHLNGEIQVASLKVSL